jgi:glutamate-5-semialdehyde dehydrogenase
MYDLEKAGRNAKSAAFVLQGYSSEQKDRALCRVADRLVLEQCTAMHANERDMEEAEKNGMSQAMLDRLKLTPARIQAMADGIRQIAGLEDPIGETMEAWDRPNGLHIRKIRVPVGVIGIIYESRPNVTADAFGLTFKSGNAVILKGGSDAIRSNTAITDIIRQALEEEGMDPDCIQLITDTDRETAKAFMRLNSYVDVMIPRGSQRLIQAVVQNCTIPVIQTGAGNCHIYVDDEADISKAIPIIINAKTQRIGVCNAVESLVVHKDIADSFMPELWKAMKENDVEVRGDSLTQQLLPECMPATEEDYGKEYLDYIISVKTVGSVDEAITHINNYHTGHSDAIITENEEHAEKFRKGIDSACVYVNASTRFTDGFEFGFGAEIGISTQKLHARGPMGLKELTSYKYLIDGNGQIRR